MENSTNNATPIEVDLSLARATDLFNGASVYRKNVVITAEQVEESQNLETVLANGLVETTRVVPAGEWIITNPGGEQYAIGDEKFKSRYEKDGDKYRAKGLIKAIKNFTNGDVEIIAPWGEKQYGDKKCYFAVALDENGNLTKDRYIIGNDEFLETYEGKLIS